MLTESPIIRAKMHVREFKQRNNIPLILPPINTEQSTSHSPTYPIQNKGQFKPYIKERYGLNRLIDVIPLFSQTYHILKETPPSKTLKYGMSLWLLKSSEEIAVDPILI